MSGLDSSAGYGVPTAESALDHSKSARFKVSAPRQTDTRGAAPEPGGARIGRLSPWPWSFCPLFWSPPAATATPSCQLR